MSYVVLYCPDGGSSDYIGEAETIDAAHDLIARHELGQVLETPEYLWETARASGNPVPGCDYPVEHDDEPVEWGGEDGCYAICETKDSGPPCDPPDED